MLFPNHNARASWGEELVRFWWSLSTSPLLSNALVSSPASLLNLGWATGKPNPIYPCAVGLCPHKTLQPMSLLNPQYEILVHQEKVGESETNTISKQGSSFWRSVEFWVWSPARSSRTRGRQHRSHLLLNKRLWLFSYTQDPVSCWASPPPAQGTQLWCSKKKSHGRQG